MTEEEGSIDLNPPPEIRLTEYELELVQKARFGLEIEHFVESEVGQYLFSLANAEEGSCDVQLRTVDPTNIKEIVDLQVRARAAGFLKDWLMEAVRAGIEATQAAEDHPE